GRSGTRLRSGTLLSRYGIRLTRNGSRLGSSGARLGGRRARAGGIFTAGARVLAAVPPRLLLSGMAIAVRVTCDTRRCAVVLGHESPPSSHPALRTLATRAGHVGARGSAELPIACPPIEL